MVAVASMIEATRRLNSESRGTAAAAGLGLVGATAGLAGFSVFNVFSVSAIDFIGAADDGAAAAHVGLTAEGTGTGFGSVTGLTGLGKSAALVFGGAATARLGGPVGFIYSLWKTK
jgi:hypothetical protein